MRAKVQTRPRHNGVGKEHRVLRTQKIETVEPVKTIPIKPIELEETEVVVETEEKIAADPLIEETEADEEDAGLNEEDLDPFGDKWEQ